MGIRPGLKADDNRESYIPYRRKDIINLCLNDGILDSETAEEFQSFCDILSAFYHFQFHHDLETIKDNYLVFNPDSEVRPLYEPSLEEYEHMGSKVVQVFEQILERANYRLTPQSMIQQALDDQSLMNLRTEVDFGDFEEFLCYYRGHRETTIPVKKFSFWKKEKKIEILERLVLLIKFKGKGYFQAKQVKGKQKKLSQKFIPGKMYVYFYKNIPKLDLELLFPNIRTSMTWRDRLILAVPAVGAAIPVLLKMLPNILLLVAAILLAIDARSTLQTMNVEAEQARNIMPVLIATLTLVIAVGGFGFRQYNQYKNKQIKFQKDVTDTLFFKNLATNATVFHRLVDLAEEEECKEIILVYYHLVSSPIPLTPEELDARIETWMIEKTGSSVDFDINGPLRNLESIHGDLMSVHTQKALLEYDEQGRCQVLSLREARAVLDYIWDNIFGSVATTAANQPLT